MQIPVDIISGCFKHDRKAQEQLYRYAYPSMMRLCLRYCKNEQDAAGVLNMAFFKIFTKIESCQSTVAFFAWMKRIMVNEALDFLRKEKRLMLDHFEPAGRSESEQVAPADQLEYDDLMAALKSLPEGQSVVFNLFALEGYSHAEIAELLGITESNSKWRLANARKLLQAFLEKTLTSL